MKLHQKISIDINWVNRKGWFCLVRTICTNLLTIVGLRRIHSTYLICCVGIHVLVPSGSSLSDVIGPRFWFKSLPGGKLNITLRGPDDGYNFRPHSKSSVGHGDAELKQPGTGSSERSFKPLSTTWSQKKMVTNEIQHLLSIKIYPEMILLISHFSRISLKTAFSYFKRNRFLMKKLLIFIY